MRKVFVLLLIILFWNTFYSQVLLKEFNLKIHFPKDYNNQVDNIIPQQVSKKLSVTPNTSNFPLSNFVSDIIVVGDTIWFATGKGVSRTYTNGQTFDNFYGIDPFGKDDIPGMAVYKNFVVVSTATTTNAGGQSNVPTGTGIKVSSDYGQTWRTYPQPKDPRYDTSIVYGYWGPQQIQDTVYGLDVVVNQDNITYSVLITRKNLSSDSIVIWTASWAGELRKSIDYGAHFTRVLLPPDNLDSISYFHNSHYTFHYDPNDPPRGNNNHKAFSIAAENDSVIYVGTAHGINKSIDWGKSWKNYTYVNTGQGSGISGNFVVSLGIQRFGLNTIIWGASDIGDQNQGGGQQAGVSYSTNGGLNWANSLTQEAGFSHTLGFKDSIVYVCTDNGIWRSIFSPNNLTWAAPYIIYDEETRDQIHTNLFFAAASQNDSIWVGSGDGLARTREIGGPWIGKWKIFRAHQPLSSSSETYAAPNPFEPKIEVTRIFYNTGKASANVTIRIFDFGMNPVRVLIQNAPRTGSDFQFTAWDGTRDDGMQVANGVYFYRIEIDNDRKIWGKILVLQ